MLTEKPPIIARKTTRLPPGQRIESMLVIRLRAHGLDETRFHFTLPRGHRLFLLLSFFPRVFFFFFFFFCEREVCFYSSFYVFFPVVCFVFLWEFEQGASC